MKGIILAAGKGTRLQPLTSVTSKQLLPVYDRPLIWYPLHTLLDAGITDILFIIAKEHAGDFLRVLGSGKQFGAQFFYEIQETQEGTAHAYMIAEQFIQNSPTIMIFGDNIFEDSLRSVVQSFQDGAHIFTREVADPHRFGVVEQIEGKVISIEEKPEFPKSSLAQTGVFICDATVTEKAKTLKKSARGEYEITDLMNCYLQEQRLRCSQLQGAWFDAGTFESLHAAGVYMREKVLEQ